MRLSITRCVCCVVLVAFLSGCASTGYWANRRRDAADVVTLTVGAGVGVKAHVGPLQLGMFFNCAEAGLRGGGFVKNGMFEQSEMGWPKSFDAIFWAFGGEFFEGSPLSLERGKSYTAATFMYLTAAFPESLPASVFNGPKKTERPSGIVPKYNPVPYWTQIEAALGIGGTLRAGLNLGEFIDLVLGFTTLDIFGDDVGPSALAMKLEESAKKPDESTKTPDQPSP